MTLDELRASDAAVLTITQGREVFVDPEGHMPDERTIRRGCETGQLPRIRIGRRLYLLRLPLLALLEAGGGPDA